MTFDRKRYLELIEARISNPISLQKALKEPEVQQQIVSQVKTAFADANFGPMPKK